MGRLRSVSLRTRLLVGVLVLVLAALTAFGAASVTLLRSYLLDRVDTQLVESSGFFSRGADETGRPPFDADRTVPGRRPPRFGANRFALAVLNADGTVETSTASGYTDSPDPLPDVPQITLDEAKQYTSPFTVGAQGNPGFRYRVLVTPNSSIQRTFVMAVPINSDDETINRLITVEAILGLVVLAMVGALGWRVVRVGLRPLDHMTDTATAIAGGDLSQRVDLPADRADEVGRLGQALDAMLGQIEAAFRERELSEEHLRHFVADASHELRTPLTSIRGYAELYRRGALESPEAVADALRRIEDQAARMSTLVDDLLLLARLDQGRALEQEPVDLVGVAGDAVSDFGAMAPDHVITYDHDGEAVVVGDPARLHQLVANLLDNARVHTPAGTTVTVTVRNEDEVVALRVADSGPGMTDEVAARVFERSFRVENGSGNHAGSGLGLSIVKAIAEAHGGTVSVESQVSHGTTFIVRLPFGGRPTP